MHLLTPAIICAVRPHGEHGAIVRALTPTVGLQAGYVRGGRSRRLRPTLGNLAAGFALSAFDTGIEATKALLKRLSLESLARRFRR